MNRAAYADAPYHTAIDHFEVIAEAAAGVNLTDGTPWWGSRVRYRQPPARRWSRVLLVDVHPFDAGAIAAALDRVAAGVAR